MPAEGNKKKPSSQGQTILIATGASGGHVFPALAVADELTEFGYNCVFIGCGKNFISMVEGSGYRSIILPASPWNIKNPVRKLWAGFNLIRAMSKAVATIHKERASAVFGTGGYATVATILAARISGVPTIIQDQNVLPGRANRFLARWVDKVCLSFEDSRHYLKYRPNIMTVCGNPIRKRIINAKSKKREDNGKFNILVLGGSQGARILSDIVPEAVNLLPDEIKAKVVVTQQTRPEDVVRVEDFYAKNNVEHKVEKFFNKVEDEIVNSNIVIGRSGASTVNECSILGRAAILVPTKSADGHQLLNAKVMADAEAAVILEQPDFTPKKLMHKLLELIEDKSRLENMEQRSVTLSNPDAAKLVAKEVIALASQDVMHLAEEINKSDETAA